MRGTAAALGAGLWLWAAVVRADEPREAAGAPAARTIPTDGDVAFAYSRADDVSDCSQPDEAAMRYAVQGVMRVDPFVPAGKEAPVKLEVRVARPRPGAVRATFELRDAAGASMGSSFVEDRTCDGAHLKLIASIALLIQAKPAPVTKTVEGSAGAAATRPGGVSSPPASAAGGPGAAKPPEAGAGRGAGARVDRSAVCKPLLLGYCAPVDIYSLSLALGGVMSLNVTAGPGPGAWLNAELRPIEMFSMGVELRGTFPSTVVAARPTDPTQPYGTPKTPDVSSFVGMLVPCFRYSWLMGCGVVQLGLIAAQTPAGLAVGTMAGAGPRVGLEIPFAERFFVRAYGDVMFSFIESGLDLTDQNLTWDQDAVYGFVGAGAGVTFR